MDFAGARLLDGLEGPERAAREQLLTELADDGFSLEELRAAVAEDRLALLPVERVLGGRYTAEEVEQHTATSAEMMVHTRRLLGLPAPAPDDRVFGDEDIEAAKAMQLFLDAGFSEDAIAEITRVLGEGCSRLAATISAAFAETSLKAGDSEEQVATRFAELASQLRPAVTPILIGAYNQHLRESVRRGMLGRAELEAGQFPDAPAMSVCFADLVGFTRLGGEVEAEELGSVASRFAQLATESAEPPVRLIKTIGDAAMLVAPEPAAVVAASLSLIEAVQEAGLPQLRAGVAHGPALLRAGDYYGNTVNLASRVTGIARPGSTLATQEVRDAALDEFDWSFAGRHRLKGVPHPVPLHRPRPRLSPAELDESAMSGAERDGEARKLRADRRRRRASR
jgi:adenylate cyclase